MVNVVECEQGRPFICSPREVNFPPSLQMV
jgi:hypothetical protein